MLKFLLCLTIFAACQREKTFDQIEIYGHAASGLENPVSVYHDNSLEAIELALGTEGCDGVEIDLQMAADSTIWLYHDTELFSQTNFSGCISQLKSYELKDVEYSSFHKEKLLPLAALDTVLLKNKSIFLDLRHLNPCEKSFLNPQNFIQELSNLGYLSAISFEVYILISYDEWIQPFSDAGYKVYYSAINVQDAREKLTDYNELDGLVIRNSEVEKDDVSEWVNKSKKVYIYEVRSPKGIRRAYFKFPSGILADDLSNALIEKY